MVQDNGYSTLSLYRAIQWGPVIAGALAAAALAFVLHSFAGAIGLAVSSTAPTWRDASFGLVFLSGFYLVAVAALAYGLGGYIAGSMRAPAQGASTEEVEVRDGANGLIVWALATVITAVLLVGGGLGLSRLAAPSSGAAGPGASVAGENIIAFDLDKLFRSEGARAPGDVSARRAEAARILLTSSSHSGVQSDDRAYLVRLVAAQTGLSQPDAERRVDTAIASAKDNITRARRAAVLLAFMTGTAALAGAAAAWAAACAGGRHRDDAMRGSIWRTRRTA